MAKLISTTKTSEVIIEDPREAQEIVNMLETHGIKVILAEK